MTSRQQHRLELAERFCRLAMRHTTCGLDEQEGYRPDVVACLFHVQDCFEKATGVAPGSFGHFGRHAAALRVALFAWMESIGIDPSSREKAETQIMAMELAQEALGVEYEGNVTQTDTAKVKWVERTADERASTLLAEFSSGKIKTNEELRIAMAAEILEAEHVAREPFLKYANAMFTSCEQGMTQRDQEVLKQATVDLLVTASRWMDIKPSERQEVAK